MNGYESMNHLKSIKLCNEDYFYGKMKISIELSEKEKQDILNEFPVPTFPNSQDVVNILESTPGSIASNVLVLVDEVQVKKASNQNPYLDLRLSNCHGSFKAKVWADNGSIDESLSFFENNQYAYVDGKVEEFPKNSGNRSLTIRTYNDVTHSINPMSLLPVSKDSMEDMILELIYYINQTAEPHKSVALAGLKTFWSHFSLAPGAKGHHHAYLGGLLKHTLELIRAGWYITRSFTKPAQGMFAVLDTIQKEHKKEMALNLKDNPLPYQRLTWSGAIEYIYEVIHLFVASLERKELDFDLFVASAVWHDKGKIFDYTYAGDLTKEKYQVAFPYMDLSAQTFKPSGGFSMDELGSSIGHMAYGIKLLEQTIKENEIPVDLETMHQYMHNILSHHGKFEWGSSTLPQTPTAFLLHLVDFISARYEKFASTQ